jgi:hypothetical protein
MGDSSEWLGTHRFLNLHYAQRAGGGGLDLI